MFNTSANIQLGASWMEKLEGEFQQPYMQELRVFLRAEKDAGKVIYPPEGEMFNAFAHTPLEKVRVVILGQDPYPGPGQAHGLCFSVRPGVRRPPSLVNIYEEIERDLYLDRAMPDQGCLTGWAEQGVLLLNSVLSVEKFQAGSHRRRGWEQFTDRVIETVNRDCEHVVFMLWGAAAQHKDSFIDGRRHLVLKTSHPSRRSARLGFLGCGHFSTANCYLKEHDFAPINWADV